MIDNEDLLLMRSYIQKIATGPNMSKNLNLADARMGMQLILENRADPVQAAIFLIALRMKRETEEENNGILEALRNDTQTALIDNPALLEMADPFDGFLRHVPGSPFVPVVLASCGLPCYSHGVASMGPKYGLTHRNVFEALGIEVNFSPLQASDALHHPDIGWAYLDQQHYAPGLHQLTDLRSKMIKRPCITTLEVMAGAVRSRHKNYLLTGYVHKPYREVYLNLARHAGYHGAIIIRGVEGGTLPSLRNKANFGFYIDALENQLIHINPEDFSIKQATRAHLIPEEIMRQQDNEEAKLDLGAFAEFTANAGKAALKGESGIIRDSIIITSAICLAQFGFAENFNEATQKAAAAIDSGEAYKRLFY